MLVSKLTLQTKPAAIDVTPLHDVATSPMCFYQNLSTIHIVLGEEIFSHSRFWGIIISIKLLGCVSLCQGG